MGNYYIGNNIILWYSIFGQIYFQSMQTDDISDDGAYGEFEIERVPVRMLEARSKDLVPVFDYLQNPKFQQGRYVESYCSILVPKVLWPQIKS